MKLPGEGAEFEGAVFEHSTRGRGGLKQGRAEVYVPLVHPPGEAEADFGFAEVVNGGERVTAALFVMTLPHSDAFFVRAFPSKKR